MIDIPNAIKTGLSIYKVVSLLISDIYDELGQVYIDMADAHLTSARQSFIAIENSRDSETEMRLGINHLRDCYNIYYTVIRRLVSERDFIFWTKESYPDRNNDTTLLTTNIAMIISLLYKELGETKNAKFWKKKTLKSFDYYRDNYIIDLDKLKKRNKKFVVIDRYTSSSTGLERDNSYLTKKGEKYIEKQFNQQKKDLKRMLKNEK